MGVNYNNFDQKRICCLGAGYVGATTMTVIADKCRDINVIVTDINQDRINAWNSTVIPIYEPGLQELVFDRRGKNLFFTTNMENAVATCDIIFISVNTPPKTAGVGAGEATDMSSWELAARYIAKYSKTSKIIVEKSTVPVGTADLLTNILTSCAHDGVEFTILSNPEFLAEGTAINDVVKPDRILIGGPTTEFGKWASKLLASIYANWVSESKILQVNVWSGELAKLAANAMLAQRISSINSLSMVCEKVGADILEVSRAVGSDTRVGAKFLEAGVGYGGSCFHKDILSLCYIADRQGLPEVAEYWRSVERMNELQKTRIVEKFVSTMFRSVKNKKVTIFGFSFKSDTSDVRGTPAVSICQQLLTEGAELSIWDPRADQSEAMKEFIYQNYTMPTEKFSFANSVEESVRDSHGIIIVTPWREFKTYNYHSLIASMQKPAVIFDGRNILNPSILLDAGFQVHCLGRAPEVIKNLNAEELSQLSEECSAVDLTWVSAIADFSTSS